DPGDLTTSDSSTRVAFGISGIGDHKRRPIARNHRWLVNAVFSTFCPAVHPRFHKSLLATLVSGASHALCGDQLRFLNDQLHRRPYDPRLSIGHRVREQSDMTTREVPCDQLRDELAVPSRAGIQNGFVLVIYPPPGDIFPAD